MVLVKFWALEFFSVDGWRSVAHVFVSILPLMKIWRTFQLLINFDFLLVRLLFVIQCFRLWGCQEDGVLYAHVCYFVSLSLFKGWELLLLIVDPVGRNTVLFRVANEFRVLVVDAAAHNAEPSVLSDVMGTDLLGGITGFSLLAVGGICF